MGELEVRKSNRREMMAPRGMIWNLIIFTFCGLLSVMNAKDEKYYENDGETSITYDEEFENLDVMATVDIALSSFVTWNIVSVFAGMFMCCFIQLGYYKFAEEEEPKSIKETPY